jgi:hypothetical protein
MFVFLIVFMIMCCPVLAAEETIETVIVHLAADGTHTIPPNAAKRMGKSVSTIGEQLIVGRKAAEVAAKHEAYEKLIEEVFDRVLVGYSVQQVQILPNGHTADICLRLSPWGDAVQQAVLEVDFGGVSPKITELIRQDMGNIQSDINEALVGLPVDAVEWAGSAVKGAIREKLEARLPEFRSSIDIVAGTQTMVKLTLSPTSPVVQDVHIMLRSQTIPNLLLEQLRPALETTAQDLVGMPVALIDRHRAYFTKQLADFTAQHKLAKRFGILFTPSINAAGDTEVSFKAETNLYNFTIDGYLDMGRQQDNSSFKLHMGKKLTSKVEAFMETAFIPGSVTWKFTPGIFYHFDYTAAGFKYDISSQHSILLLKQYLGNRWSARFERTPADGSYEFALRYNLHEFISAEYVFTNTDRWLRLVGHL